MCAQYNYQGSDSFAEGERDGCSGTIDGEKMKEMQRQSKYLGSVITRWVQW